MKAEGIAQHDGQVILDRNAYRVIDCAACSFLHVDPLPSEAELLEFCRDEFYEDAKPTYLASDSRDAEWLAVGHDMKLDELEGVLAPGSRRILDIGTGPGAFLRRATSRGWEATGIDPSPAAVAHCRSQGLEALVGHLSDDTVERLGAFDAVHLQHVLEHVRDPQRFLDTARTLLRPGGVICVEVPNDFNPLQRVLLDDGVDPWFVSPPEHLNYFTLQSLLGLLERRGFTPLVTFGAFPMEFFLLAGIDYVTEPERGREAHLLRAACELRVGASRHRDVLRSMYTALAEVGVGRELVVLATADGAPSSESPR